MCIQCFGYEPSSGRLFDGETHTLAGRFFRSEPAIEPRDEASPAPFGPLASPGVSGIDLTGNAAVDALFVGNKWSGSTLTFSFPTMASAYDDYGFGANESDTFSPVSLELRNAIRQIFGAGELEPGGARFAYGSIASFTNMNFTEVAEGGGDLRYAFSEEPAVAFGYYPWTSAQAGDSWFNGDYMGQFAPPQPGSYVWLTAMHEIGHNLGLKHGHTADGMTGLAVPAEFDSLEFTVMTYRSFIGGPVEGGYTVGAGGYPQTFMMLDIAALQHMYGADFTANAGATTYTWDPTTGEMSLNGVGQGLPIYNKLLMTIWDGGGIDTYDLSNYGAGVTVDLTPGGHSVFSVDQLAQLGLDQFARGNVFNALLYQGDLRSLIENAIGTDHDDVFVGNVGINTLAGRSGDDTYFVQNAGDRVVELDGQGSDRVFSSVSYDLAGTYVERLELTGSANINATGNSLANALVGNGGNNVLNGGAGGDDMAGLGGDDTYYVDNAADRVFELNRNGSDRVFSSVSFSLAGQFIERLELTGSANIDAIGNSLDNALVGNAGDNVLNGMGGDDDMAGLGGDDTYHVDNVSDRVFELDGNGSDRVFSSVSFSIDGQHVERLELTGSANINATGNSLDNALVGNAGNNLLNGMGGDDDMAGLAGDDVYIVDHARDRVFELDGNGFDEIRASVSYDLVGRYVERLVLTGSADIDAVGNSLANRLVGNAGDNVLDGRGGADQMAGDRGDDTYFVDSRSDRVWEFSNEGQDTVFSSVDFNLGGIHAEVLTLTGRATYGVGNGLDNTLTGTAGSNVLLGDGGEDIIIGGLGQDRLGGGSDADTFVFRSLADSTVALSDRITDLGASDLIDLSAIDADAGTAGDQAFALVDAFTGATGQAVLTLEDGVTHLNLDVDGDGVSDFLLRLQGDHREHEGWVL